MHVKRIIKETVKWSLISVSALLLFAVLLFGLVQTGPGKERIGSLIGKSLSKDRDTRIEIGIIDGFIPFDIRIDHLTFWDSGSQWLRLEGVFLRWSPWTLLGGNFVVDELRIVSARVNRPPVDRSEKTVGKEAIPPWLKTLHRLQVRHFSVERMVLDESVLGEQAVFKIEAGMGISFPDGAWETRINIERLDQNGAPTTLRALFEVKGTDLTADAIMEEPAGGLVAKSLGIEGPILFSLKGKGPTNAWKGAVIAEGGALGKLQAELGLSISDMDLQLTAKGHVHMDPSIVPDPFIHWVDQNTPFELRGSIHRKRRVTIDDLNLKSKKAALQFNASVDLMTEAIEGRFKLKSDDLSPMEQLASIKGAGGTVDGLFSGSLLKPEASLDFNAAELQAGDVQAKDVQGHVKVVFTSPIDVIPIQIRAESTGNVGQLAFKSGSELLSEKDVAWTLAVEGPPSERLSIEEFTLKGRPASVSLSGWIDTSSRTGNVDADINMADLSTLSRIVNGPISGRARIQAKLTGDAGNRSASARITGEYQPPETLGSSLVSLMGRQVDYSGTFTYDGQKKINGSDLLLDTISGTIKGDVAYDLGDGGLNGVFQMEIPKLDRFSPVLGKEIQGSVLIKGAVKGPFQRLGVEARMVSREIRFEKVNLEKLSAGLRIEGFPPENKGKLDFDLYVEHEKVRGQTHFALNHQLLSFTDLSMNGAGVSITGALSLNLEQRLIEGTLQGATDDLVSLSALSKQEVNGAAEIFLEASGTNSGQRFVFKIDSSDLSIQDLFVGKVKLQGEIDKAFKAPEGLVTVSLREGKHKGSRVTSLEMNLRGTPERFHFEGNLEGIYREDFELETSGRVSLSPEGQEILLNRFQGRYGKLPVNLVQPAVVSNQIEGLDVKPINLQIGSGRLDGSGKIGKDVSIAVQFVELSLSALPMSITSELVGKANGQIRIEGSSRNPEVEGRLKVEGFGMHLPQTETLPPGTFEVETELRAGKLHADMILQGITTTPMKARFEAPMALTLAPFSVSLPHEKPVSGEFTGEVNMGLIAEIFALHDQTIAGRLILNLTLAGHFGDLNVRGGGRMEDGFYENVRTGTILKEIEALFEARDRKILIQSVQASDGESGTIKAQGWIDITPVEGFPFLVDLVLDDAKTWRHDDVMVTLSGPLKLSGSLKALLLEGRIQITRAEIRIPDRLPPDIVQLEVVEINRHDSGSAVNKEKSSTPESIRKRDLRLDVSVSSSGHVFVEGRGLSSEWKVKAQVNGTAAVPVITGEFSVIRGHVNFLGKRFNLTRGMILFSGATPPSPQIEVLGESRANDMTAQIELTGPLNHPTVKLSSDPELPQDEVLSRLLFGRSVTNITPYQAVQLASAANTLAGGGGFDLLGETRKILGVDQLEIKNLEGDKGEPAISAGKYLSEHVYMEVEKGLGPKGGKGSVVWEMTPNITVETEVGENAEIGGGVNWKWDY